MTLTSSRRTLRVLGAAALLIGLAPLPALAQGRCMLTFGTPACNTTADPAGVRADRLEDGRRSTTSPSGSPTIRRKPRSTSRSWDGSCEATTASRRCWTWATGARRSSGRRLPGAFDAPAADGGARARRRRCARRWSRSAFAIEPWNAKTVEAELRKRGLNPVADNDGKGFESFHVKDPDGFDLQISNGNGLAKSRKASPANAKLSRAGAVRVDRLEDGVARPFLVQRGQLQEERVVLHATCSAGRRPTTKAARTS